MIDTLIYLIVKLRLLLWVSRLITPDCDAVQAVIGGDTRNELLRDTAIELLLGEVRHGSDDYDIE